VLAAQASLPSLWRTLPSKRGGLGGLSSTSLCARYEWSGMNQLKGLRPHELFELMPENVRDRCPPVPSFIIHVG
jgi:hypothetical protein